jgi:hypothetical protein
MLTFFPVILGMLISLLFFSTYYIISNEKKLSALEQRLGTVETQLIQIGENLELVSEVFSEAQKIKDHIQIRSKINTEQATEVTYAILYSARVNKLNPYLLLAIAETESSFYPNAVGRIGERGLIQVRYGTFKMMLKQGDFYHWRDTLQAGANYLVYLFALAGYNAGPNRTRERLMELASPYIKKVERNYARITRNNQYTTSAIYSRDLKNAGWAETKV